MVSIEYLAGVFDSEGSVGAYQSYVDGHFTGHYLQVSVTNTFEPVVLAFQQMFGGTVYPIKRISGTKAVYRWQIRSTPALQFLATILPYLWEKAPQAEIALRFPNCVKHGFRRCPDEVRNQQAHLAEELKSLKK